MTTEHNPGQANEKRKEKENNSNHALPALWSGFVSVLPEIAVFVLLIVFLSVVGSTYGETRGLIRPKPETITGREFVELKVEEVTSGSNLVEAGDIVNLQIIQRVTGESKEVTVKEVASASDLEVLYVLDTEGKDVARTGKKANRIILSVSEDKFDEITTGLHMENIAAYLLPQEEPSLDTSAPIPPGKYDVEVQFQLKASDLASGAILARLNELVTLVLVTDDDGEKNSNRYEDLQVLALLDANGHSVTGSGAPPDGILLSVPTDKFDAIAKGLQQEKKMAYLLPQGTAVAPTPPPITPTGPGPTATVAAGSVAFPLPADKIQSDLKSLKPGDNVVVIVVVERKDADGKIVEHKAHRHDGATLLDVLDKDDVPLASPYKGKITVHISLPLGTNGDPAVEFAGQLADASAIYLLPEPTPTPTQGG